MTSDDVIARFTQSGPSELTGSSRSRMTVCRLVPNFLAMVEHSCRLPILTHILLLLVAECRGASTGLAFGLCPPEAGLGAFELRDGVENLHRHRPERAGEIGTTQGETVESVTAPLTTRHSGLPALTWSSAA